MMLRAARAAIKRTAPLLPARRTGSDQANTGEDLTWLEADNREMTAEERYALRKQREMLAEHAEALNANLAAAHQETRALVETHVNKNAAHIASLEAQLVELANLVAQLKAEQKDEE